MPEDYIEAAEAPHVDAGSYLAELETTERVKTRFGEARKWHFTLSQADAFKVSTITSLATSAGSNGGRMIRALLGRGLSSGEKLPLEELAGKRCMLTLSVSDDGWNRIEEVEPLGAGSNPAEPLPPEPPSDQLEFAGY
jgi:hypothetical protein